ncbi:hypothetical protein K431DRAFT_300990 [Polychaeton citri CBS 116435]|uniref:Uncharacterized protein n=1 Tax=Polychaeton citri CBS 116435 TaxID=1314669 RepID=A0A9P4UT05_9PEZI|nr:hypothetical protein K431DRAFT_300990 [Polychaeton citri CBS 116435]
MFLPASHERSIHNGPKPPRVQQRMRGLAHRRYDSISLALDSTKYYPTVVGPRSCYPGFPTRRDTLPGHCRYDWPRDIVTDFPPGVRTGDIHCSRRRAAESLDEVQGVPFADAAAKLDQTLLKACSTTEDFLSEFEEDICRIACYADDRTIDFLWMTKLKYDGHNNNNNKNASTSARGKNAKSLGFKEALEHLEEAAVEIKTCQPPHWTSEDGRDRLSSEQVRSIMKKLNVSFESIKELMDIVTKKRGKMVVLHKELVATHRLLCEMHEFWRTKDNAKGKPFAELQASFEDDPFDDERWDG